MLLFAVTTLATICSLNLAFAFRDSRVLAYLALASSVLYIVHLYLFLAH